jgi:aspartate carbamoyltransferase catalytic subunit
LTTSIVDGAKSVINEQVMNGVAIRMALLYIFTRGGRYEDVD